MNSGDMNLGRFAGRALDQISTFIKKTDKTESAPISFTEKFTNSVQTSQELQQKPTEFKPDSKEFVKSHLETGVGMTLVTTGTLASVALLPLVGLGAIGGGIVGGTVKQLGKLLPEGSSLKEQTKNADRLGFALGVTIGSLGTAGMALAGLKMMEKEAPIKPQMEARETAREQEIAIAHQQLNVLLSSNPAGLEGLDDNSKEVAQGLMDTIARLRNELNTKPSVIEEAPAARASEPRKPLRPMTPERRRELDAALASEPRKPLRPMTPERRRELDAALASEPRKPLRPMTPERRRELDAARASEPRKPLRPMTPERRRELDAARILESSPSKDLKEEEVGLQPKPSPLAALQEELDKTQNKMMSLDPSDINVIEEYVTLDMQRDKLEKLIPLHHQLQIDQKELNKLNDEIALIDEKNVSDDIFDKLAEKANQLEDKIEAGKQEIAKLEGEIKDLTK